MKKIHHSLPVGRENIRLTEDIQFGIILAHLVESTDFPQMSFDQSLVYLRKNTKMRIHQIRRKLLDTYRMMGIIIDLSNRPPPKTV